MKKLHSSIITPITIPVRDHSSGLPPTTVGPAFSVPTPGDNIVSYLFVVKSCHLLFSLITSLFLLLQPLPLVLKFFLSIFIFVLIFLLLLLLLSSFFSPSSSHFLFLYLLVSVSMSGGGSTPSTFSVPTMTGASIARYVRIHSNSFCFFHFYLCFILILFSFSLFFNLFFLPISVSLLHFLSNTN